MRRQLMMPAHPPMTKNRGMIWKSQEAMANPVVRDSATVGTTLPSGPSTAALISEWRTTTTTRQAKRTRSMAGSRRDPARVVGREDEGGGETGVLRDAEPEDVGAAAWGRAGGGPLVAGCGVVAAADGPSRVRDMGAPGTVLRSMTASKLGAGFACAHHHGVSTRGHRTDTFGGPSAHPRPYRKLTAVPAGGRRAVGCPQACAGLPAGRRHVPKRRSPRDHGWPQPKS